MFVDDPSVAANEQAPRLSHRRQIQDDGSAEDIPGQVIATLFDSGISLPLFQEPPEEGDGSREQNVLGVREI